MKQKESDLQKAIIDLLRLKKFIVVKFASVGIWDKSRGVYIRQGQKGVSDLLACGPDGKFWAIEVKIKPNKATEEQLYFLSEVEQKGGVAILAYNLDDVLEKL